MNREEAQDLIVNEYGIEGEVIISKKLAIEILGFGIQEIKVSENGKNLLYTNYEKPRIQDWKYINNHELVYRCKKWAYENQFKIQEDSYRVDVVGVGDERLHTVFDVCDNKNNFNPIRVFKCCEWVLEQKEKHE